MAPFTPAAHALELCHLAFYSDYEARIDLSRGYIRDENDYTSTFVSTLRRNINAHSRLGLTATSFALPHRLERRTGCDGAVVVTHRGRSKVALFEAKWPRVSTPGYSWDYAQTASGQSHLSDQLTRQSRLSSACAVFEMFYCEFPVGAQPPFMLPAVSSCVWRDSALQYESQRPLRDTPWSQDELRSMLSAEPPMSIADVLLALCKCVAAQPIGGLDDPRSFAEELRLEGEVIEVRVPDDVSPASDE